MSKKQTAKHCLVRAQRWSILPLGGNAVAVFFDAITADAGGDVAKRRVLTTCQNVLKVWKESKK